MGEKLTDGINELVELAEDGRREFEFILDLLAIPDETLGGLRVAIFLDLDGMAPPDHNEEFEEYRRRFERLCDSMPHVSRQCLKMLGHSCASISLFFRTFEKGELTIRSGALYLTTAAMALGAAASLLPAAIDYLSAEVQAKRKAALSKAGRQGATVRNQQYQELKEWARENGKKLGASKVIARRLAPQLPAHLSNVSKDPERLIYDALRSSKKPD